MFFVLCPSFSCDAPRLLILSEFLSSSLPLRLLLDFSVYLCKPLQTALFGFSLSLLSCSSLYLYIIFWSLILLPIVLISIHQKNLSLSAAARNFGQKVATLNHFPIPTCLYCDWTGRVFVRLQSDSEGELPPATMSYAM